MKDDKYVTVPLGTVCNTHRYTPKSLAEAVAEFNARPSSARVGENKLHGYQSHRNEPVDVVNIENVVLTNVILDIDATNTVTVSGHLREGDFLKHTSKDDLCFGIRGYIEPGPTGTGIPQVLTSIQAIDLVDPEIRKKGMTPERFDAIKTMSMKGNGGVGAALSMSNAFDTASKSPNTTYLGMIDEFSNFVPSAFTEVMAKATRVGYSQITVYGAPNQPNGIKELVLSGHFNLVCSGDKVSVLFGSGNEETKNIILDYLSQGFRFSLDINYRPTTSGPFFILEAVNGICLHSPSDYRECVMKEKEKNRLRQDSTLPDMLRRFVMWGAERGITINGNIGAQTTKLYEEAGEIASGICKSDRKKVIDGVGDVMCTLSTTLAVCKIDITQHLPTFFHTDEIFLTEDPHEAMRVLMEPMSRLITTLNTRTSRVAARMIAEDLEFVFYALSDIAATFDAKLMDCAIAAWLEIKDRKGTFDASGMFVKETDL